MNIVGKRLIILWQVKFHKSYFFMRFFLEYELIFLWFFPTKCSWYFNVIFFFVIPSGPLCHWPTWILQVLRNTTFQKKPLQSSKRQLMWKVIVKMANMMANGKFIMYFPMCCERPNKGANTMKRHRFFKKKPYFIFKLIFYDENNYKFNNFCFVNPKIVKWTLCTPPHLRLLMVPK
jgi:hypothetical protein